MTESVTEPADPWPHSPYPQLELVLGASRRRPPAWWWRIGGAAVTAVLAVTAFLVALSGAEPAADALPFRPLEQLRQLDFAEPTENTFSRVVGDRTYLAWQQGDDLELAALDLAAGGEERWRSRIAGADEQWWGELIATPTAVVALGYPYEPESDEAQPQPRPMVVLDAATGGERYRWGRDIYPYDEVWVVGETLVLADRAGGALRGLRLDTGVHRWVEPFRGRPGGAMAVVPVLGAELLAAPSTWWGAPATTAVDQLVLVGEDRTARLVDLATGELVGAAGSNVAGPDDFLLAYQGRLYVGAGDEGYQLQVRDLADLAGQPEHLYTAPDPRRRLAAVVPCAAELLCLLDRYPSDHRDTEVRVLDLSADRGRDPQRWARAVPQAEWLVPAGDWLLVGGGDPIVAGYRYSGEQVFTVPAGAAARIDAHNLLLFSELPDDHAQDLALAGQPIATEPGRVELGQLAGVHGQRCSWNDTYLVCPGDEGAGVWRFRP